MTCYSPLTAYRQKGGGITFSRGSALTGMKLKLPCGRCIGCRLERARQWALRIHHESKLHSVNSFITLTYDDVHLGPAGTLILRDLQLFMKRLRKSREPSIVRFFGCGEYGELTCRPHYHAILFNCGFADLKRIGSNAQGDLLFSSDELRELWPKGNNIIGEVNARTAAYVARYSVKKVNGPLAKEHYCVIDGDGVCYDRLPEFVVMSRRPGIGSGYYDRFGGEVRSLDNCVFAGQYVRPPRFYDSRTEGLDPERFELIKRNRLRRARTLAADNTVARLRVREVLALKRFNQLQRGL